MPIGPDAPCDYPGATGALIVLASVVIRYVLWGQGLEAWSTEAPFVRLVRWWLGVG
jgi:hypothetical protein